MKHHTVLPGRLRGVERGVREAEQIVARGRLRIDRDAEARGDAEGLRPRPLELERGQLLAKALRQPLRTQCVGLGQEDRELLSAEPGRKVDVPEARAEDATQRAQDVVAGLVPETVVHELEVVEIREDEREWAL